MSGQPAPAEETTNLSLQPLLNLLDGDQTTEGSFDEIMDNLLPEFLRSKAVLQEQEIETDQHIDFSGPEGQTVESVRGFVIHQDDNGGKSISDKSPRENHKKKTEINSRKTPE